MAKKKVMLFIVEGPTDETSLSTVLNRIFSSATVKFQRIPIQKPMSDRVFIFDIIEKRKGALL